MANPTDSGPIPSPMSRMTFFAPAPWAGENQIREKKTKKIHTAEHFFCLTKLPSSAKSVTFSKSI